MTKKAKSSKKANNGQTIKTETASAAIAAITANIAATTLSINDIDNTPIIEEERVPEENALVRQIVKLKKIKITIKFRNGFPLVNIRQDTKSRRLMT